MQKTSNYNLKKPEFTDPVRLADFNDNADLIDAALAEMPKLRFGSYTGTGVAGRTVHLGYTPKLLFLISHTVAGLNFSVMTDSASLFMNTENCGANTSRVVEGGFHTESMAYNYEGKTSYYIAVL